MSWIIGYRAFSRAELIFYRAKWDHSFGCCGFVQFWLEPIEEHPGKMQPVRKILKRSLVRGHRMLHFWPRGTSGQRWISILLKNRFNFWLWFLFLENLEFKISSFNIFFKANGSFFESKNKTSPYRHSNAAYACHCDCLMWLKISLMNSTRTLKDRICIRISAIIQLGRHLCLA